MGRRLMAQANWMKPTIAAHQCVVYSVTAERVNGSARPPLSGVASTPQGRVDPGTGVSVPRAPGTETLMSTTGQNARRFAAPKTEGRIAPL